MNKRNKLKKAFIHIGFPKTGTSTLQKHLFPKLKRLKFLGTHHFGKRLDLVYDVQSGKRVSKDYQELQKNDLPILLSDESLTPSQDFSINQGDTLNKYEKIAINLKTLFERHGYSPSIIFTIRRQDSMILSQYSQFFPWYQRNVETNSFDKYYHLFVDSEQKSSLREALNYHAFYEIYKSVFGAENISVLIFEELVSDTKKYYTKLFEILSIDDVELFNEVLGKIANSKSGPKGERKVENTSLLAVLSIIKSRLMPRFKLSGFEGLKRRLNKLKVSSNASTATSIMLNESEIKKIMSVYEESNKALAEELGLNLQTYGYFKRNGA